MAIKILRELLLIRKELLLIREELQAIRKYLESKTRVSIGSTAVSEATCDRAQEALLSLQNPDHRQNQQI